MSLKIWLPLNGNIENQGLADVTITNNGATVDNNGKIGKCYSFNGGTITAPAPKITNKITVAAWIKAPDNNSGWRRVCGMQSAAISWQSASALLMLNGTNLYFSISNGSTCTSGGCVFNIGDSSNWFHACGTYDGTTARLYVNGVLKKEFAIATTIENTPIWLGGTSAGERFTGKLNDFRLYDHCLSPKEVKEISKGLVLHYPLNDAACSKNLASNTDWERTSNTEYMKILDSYQDAGTGEYTFSCEMKVAAGTPNVCIYSTDWGYTSKYTYSVSDIYTNGVLNGKLSQQWQKVVCKLTFTVSEEDSTVMPHISTYYTYGSGAIVSVRNPKLEKGWNPNPIYTNSLYDTVYDCSGYQNNGTISGALSCSANSPRYKISTHFTSSIPSRIMLPSDMSCLSGSNEQTLSCWVKSSGLGSGMSNSGLVSLGYGNTLFLGSSYYGYRIDNGSDLDVLYANQNPHDGKWHLVTATYKSGIVSIYIDGVLKNSTSRTFSNRYINKGCNCIGTETNNVNTNNINGDISDVRMYATALSEEDIKELYNTSAYVLDNGTLLTYNLEE